MMDNELKVFKMNDYEWWVTDGSVEELNDWYNEHIEDNDIEEVRLCDLDKEGMWYATNEPNDIERLGNANEIMHEERTQFGDLIRKYGEVYKFISFREALSKEEPFTEPYCIASTEW
jgi:hypothetical protein